MKENFLKIIVYLFSQYKTLENILELSPSSLYKKLGEAFYTPQQIEEVFSFLSQTWEFYKNNTISLKFPHSFRVFSKEEQKKLSKEARGFILSLDQTNSLSFSMRETLIYSAMLINTESIEVPDIQCIANILFLKTEKDLNLENLTRVQSLKSIKRATVH